MFLLTYFITLLISYILIRKGLKYIFLLEDSKIARELKYLDLQVISIIGIAFFVPFINVIVALIIYFILMEEYSNTNISESFLRKLFMFKKKNK